MIIQQFSPPPRTKFVLQSARAHIESVFYESLETALLELSPNPAMEVPTLLNFFLGLPDLGKALNIELQKHRIEALIKGVFCHRRGTYGATVEPDVPPAPGARDACELADLLLLVTYGGPRFPAPFGQAMFLQAKRNRDDDVTHANTSRQLQLYSLARTFRYSNPSLYHTEEFDGPNPNDGIRWMPSHWQPGFVFWSFNSCDHIFNYRWNSSVVTLPWAYGDPSQDIPFGHAAFQMLIGDMGLPVGPLARGNYGFSRIVHDVIARAALEVVRSRGKVTPATLKAVIGQASAHDFLATGLPLVMNPFGESFGWWGSEQLTRYAEKLTHMEEMEEEVLLRYIRKFGGEPPDRNSNNLDDGPGDGVSYVHIDLRDLSERKPDSSNTKPARRR